MVEFGASVELEWECPVCGSKMKTSFMIKKDVKKQATCPSCKKGKTNEISLNFIDFRMG